MDFSDILSSYGFITHSFLQPHQHHCTPGCTSCLSAITEHCVLACVYWVCVCVCVFRAHSAEPKNFSHAIISSRANGSKNTLNPFLIILNLIILMCMYTHCISHSNARHTSITGYTVQHTTLNTLGTPCSFWVEATKAVFVLLAYRQLFPKVPCFSWTQKQHGRCYKDNPVIFFTGSIFCESLVWETWWNWKPY